jgi:serine phosphatase RsbU (regulator of sigma subunit)
VTANILAVSTSRSPFVQKDCILLFTDGLYEVDSPSGEAFGLSSVLASLRSRFGLPAKGMFDALLADACNFSGKQEFDDDVCIVAVEQS